MDATIASIVISMIVVISSYTFKLANKYWLRPKKIEKRLREQGLRGNPYKFIFGDSKDVEGMRAQVTAKPMELTDDVASRILPYHHHMVKKYGKKYFIWFGPKARLSILEPFLVKEILSRPDEFRKPRNDQMAEVLAGGLFTKEGTIWAKHKKILNPVFHIDKIKNMVPSIVESCLEMMERWNIAPQESVEIDMRPEIDALIYDIMCRTVVTGRITEETKKIYQLRIKVNQEAVKIARFLMMFPGWWNFPTQEVKTLNTAHKEIESLVKKVVTRRLEEMKNGASNGGDMLSLLLEAFQDDASEFSLEDVMEECRSFHFVGQESTSRSLIWVLYALANHSEWQEKAREEVLQVFGDQKPNVEGLNQLKIVTMIVYETLRMYPPTGLIHRSISRDTKLGDMVLPAWIQITIPITLMNNDPAIWGEDANQFKPERFAEGIYNSKMQSIFLSFIQGPRKCTGQSMAMVTHKFVVATLLQRFSLMLSPSYLHAPKHSFFLVPQHGMNLVLRKLISSSPSLPLSLHHLSLPFLSHPPLPPYSTPPFPLTFNRLSSLSRCLHSLPSAHYDSNKVNLHIFIDHFPNGSLDFDVLLNGSRQILDFIDGFKWDFGNKIVQYRTDNVGLQAQWLESWWPGHDHEFVFVVEDDLEVSPLYYKFLKRLILEYYYNESNYSPWIYGASLQRPRFVPGKHGNKIQLDRGTHFFLYQLVATWGQLLLPRPWKEFRLWYDIHKTKGTKPYRDGMVMTGWYKKLGEKIWTPWFIKFIHARGYFNIYTNFWGDRALSVSHRDAGVIYGKSAGPDSYLLNVSSLDFNLLEMQPLGNLKWYDFCFQEVLGGRVVKHADELGSIFESVNKLGAIVLVSLYGTPEKVIRNLLCHFKEKYIWNYIFMGPESTLLYDLAYNL